MAVWVPVVLEYQLEGEPLPVTYARNLEPEAIGALLMIMDALSECEPKRLPLFIANLMSEI